MIDLHAHIIPGFDDGAQTIEDALDMARTAISSGVRIMTATSHGDFSSCDPQTMIQKYRKGLAVLRSAIERAGLPLRVASGMELLVNESLLHYAEQHPLPSLNGSGYLLVEFYFDIRYTEAVRRLEVLRKMGYRLVLAHPERYDFTKRDVGRAAELADSGIILQINKEACCMSSGSALTMRQSGSCPVALQAWWRPMPMIRFCAHRSWRKWRICWRWITGRRRRKCC